MIRQLMARAEKLARDARARRIERLAGQLRNVAGVNAVEAEESRIVVSGRGLLKRWIGDPALRFLARTMK